MHKGVVSLQTLRAYLDDHPGAAQETLESLCLLVKRLRNPTEARDVPQVLVDHGASTTALNGFGRTPLANFCTDKCVSVGASGAALALAALTPPSALLAPTISIHHGVSTFVYLPGSFHAKTSTAAQVIASMSRPWAYDALETWVRTGVLGPLTHVDTAGSIPLHVLPPAAPNSPFAARLLLGGHGAAAGTVAVNTQNADGRTPLHTCVSQMFRRWHDASPYPRETLQVLLRARPNVLLRDAAGMTALDIVLAANIQSPATIARMYDENTTDDDVYPPVYPPIEAPLHLEFRQMWLEVIVMLLEHGATHPDMDWPYSLNDPLVALHAKIRALHPRAAWMAAAARIQRALNH